MVDVAPAVLSVAGTNSEVPRILLVDDDTRARRALQRDLTRAGFSVQCAEDGTSAWDLHESRGADLLITDLKMPRMDGLELTLRMSVTHPRLPIIAMTGASATDARLLSALERGAVSVLAKPFASADLVTAVRRALCIPTPSDVDLGTDTAEPDDVSPGPRWRRRPDDRDADSRGDTGPTFDDPVNH